MFNSAGLLTFLFVRYLRTKKYLALPSNTSLRDTQTKKKNRERIFFKNITSDVTCKVAHASRIAEAALMTED